MSLATYHRLDLSSYDIFAPLEVNNGTGISVRYEPIFDLIKEARREDNESLSRGIWQTELKRADWAEVERLCTQVLNSQSKDLQVFGWLMEAWLVMESMKGGIKGFQCLKKLCDLFWPILYPAITDTNEDARIFVLDWIDTTLQERMLFINITAPIDNISLRALTLADWIEALSLEKIIKRSSDSRSSLKDAEAKGKITLSRFRQGLAETPRSTIQNIYDDASQFLFTIEEFCKSFSAILNQKVTLFMGLQDQLKIISRIAETTLEQQKKELSALSKVAPKSNEEIELALMETNEDPLPPSSPTNQITTENDHEVIEQRADAYRALHELGKFLLEIDPHSPASYLLELIVSWENKKLLQIITDINEGQTEAHVLLKLLAGGPQNR